MAAPASLQSQAQVDFSGGAFRGIARHLIPPNGVYDAVNALLDEDGSLYKRGGSSYLSTSGLGTGGLTFLWDGDLKPGRRTVVANASDFGVLDGTEAMVNLGGSGLSRPRKAVVLDNVLVIGDGTLYGGSLKSANYTTGTVSVTNGSTTVTGSGTTWNTLVDAGMLFQVGTGRIYVVASITDTTHLELTEPYQGSTAAGQTYTLAPVATAPRTSSYYAVAGERLVSCEGNRAYFSNSRTTSGLLDWQTFDSTNYHELPASIIGAATLRDTLVLFSTDGIWTVSNMAYDLTNAYGDVQQRLEHVSGDHVLWGNEGVANWRGALVMPALDGVYLFSGSGAPELISKSTTPLYVGYVRAGHRPGLGKVYRNHYFLPILSAAGGFIDLLVWRLDRPQDTGLGTIFPWTRMSGSGANVSALDVRVGDPTRAPKLLASGLQTSSRVLDLSYYFEPAGTYKHDHDGSNFEFDVTTRDYTPDRLNVPATTRKLRMRYELGDAASDDPTISAWYSQGVAQDNSESLWGTALWGTATWSTAGASEEVQLAGQAPEDDGRTPYVWMVNKRGRFIRFRLRSSEPTSKLALRTLELFTRPSGRQ